MTLPPRVIPVLQLSDGYLVKTTKFAKPRYVGDPINAVKIFNDKEVDELMLVGIDVTRRNASPDFDLLESVASEAFMPVSYGGGLRTLDDALRVLEIGIEKVVLNTALRTHPDAVSEMVRVAGSQSVVASVDARRSLFGGLNTFIRSGNTQVGISPASMARQAQALGVGEVVVSSIDREGSRSGYDVELIREVAEAVTVPVVALGGAGTPGDFERALDAGASAVAAGSMFVFHGKHQAVLITYPSPEQVLSLAGRRTR
jgi:cyclase